MQRSRVLKAAGWKYAKCGAPGEVLKSESWTGAAVGAGDVKVKMVKAPVLQQDVSMVMGTYGGYKAEEYPAVAGTEGWGTVVEAGAAAGVAKGAKVVITQQNLGTWADEVTVSASSVADVSPLQITDANLALLSVYSSAVIMASGYGSVSGKTCVVLGTETPVGQVLGEALQAQGAGKVVALQQGEKLPVSVAADYIFNAVGGADLRAATDSAAEGCTVVTWDNISKERMDVAGTRAVMTGLEMRSFWFKRWLADSSPADQQAVFTQAAALSQKKSIASAEFPFKSFEQAFDTVFQGHKVPVVSM